MRLTPILFTLSLGLPAALAAPFKDLSQTLAPREDVVTTTEVGPEHVKSWECQKGQEGQKSGTVDEIRGRINHLKGVGDLINQPDNKWGQVSCAYGTGIFWRNSGTKARKVTGPQVAYYANLLLQQDNFPAVNGVPAGLSGNKCSYRGDLDDDTRALGILYVDDDWEVNMGECKG